jgi:hypothetical protein
LLNIVIGIHRVFKFPPVDISLQIQGVKFVAYTINSMFWVISVFINAYQVFIFVPVQNCLYLSPVERCYRNVYTDLTQLHVAESFLRSYCSLG